VSVITAPTEYKNPFAPPAPVAAPAPVEPTVTAPAAVAPAIETPTASAVSPAESRPVEDQPPRPAVEPEAKPAELKILPPEAPKRVEHSWESDSFRSAAGQPPAAQTPIADVPPAAPRRDDRRGDRPYFRPERERRNDRPGEGRPAWRDSSRNSPDQEARAETPSLPTPPPAAEPVKSGGLFGWLKRLFGGAPAEAPKPATLPGGDRGFGGDGHRHRRRRRGGQGRGFQDQQRDPRDGPPSGENRGNGGENRGYGGDQRQPGRRRRHYRGGGGDYRGGNRPEGGPPSGS
jgi:hypothetical protein